jgi:hypothetical protein
MENEEKNKPGEQDQSGKQPQDTNEGDSQNQEKRKVDNGGSTVEKPDLNEEEERLEGLKKTHQSNHQPLPGEGTDEAKGIADDEKDEEEDSTA